MQIPFCAPHIPIYLATVPSQDLLQTFQMLSKKKKFYNKQMSALFYGSKRTILVSPSNFNFRILLSAPSNKITLCKNCFFHLPDRTPEIGLRAVFS